MAMTGRISRLWLALVLLVLCGANGLSVSAESADRDYADPVNWSLFQVNPDHSADVFLICPASDADGAASASALGGLFRRFARLYAPVITEMSTDSGSRAQAYRDVRSAFSTYLARENKGSPLFLATSAEGAPLCVDLLSAFFEDASLQKQLVAVYVLGCPVTQTELDEAPFLHPATRSDDVGVIVNIVLDKGDNAQAFSINPLNWQTDATPADRSLNLGACFLGADGAIVREIAGYCGARLDETSGLLAATDPIEDVLPSNAKFLEGQLFYRNLQMNIAVRLDAWTEQKNQAVD